MASDANGKLSVVDPEPPTRRIPPTPPGSPPPRGTVRETEYVAEPAYEELRDKLRSLTTALALTALLALAGLGVALYTLLSEDEESDGNRRGASPARVSALSDRVDDLEERVGDRATKNELNTLEDRIEQVEQQAEQANQDDDGADTAQLQESIETLDQNLTTLEQRVDELERSGGQPAP